MKFKIGIIYDEDADDSVIIIEFDTEIERYQWLERASVDFKTACYWLED